MSEHLTLGLSPATLQRKLILALDSFWQDPPLSLIASVFFYETVFQVSDGWNLPVLAEPASSEGRDFGKAAQCENTLRESEGQMEDLTPIPHMNVIVKEEEDEEPLCGT